MSRFFVILALTFAGSALTACGGAFDGDDEPSGSSGSAGTSGHSGSGGGPGGGASCEWNGEVYLDGATFDDDCNSCFCDDGSVGCTTRACLGDCTYEGMAYQVGDEFPAGDGCNTCSCEQGGNVSCTLIGCSNSCDDIADQSFAAVEAAGACDPLAAGQCTQLVAGALDCGCPTYVNAENTEAIAELADLHEQYANLACGPSPCDCAAPTSGYCASNGQCVDSYDGEGPASCKVNGQVYPSGSTGFPGPLDCNTCSCADGELTCTEEACPSACPPDSVPGSQCAECGPSDGCEVVEYTCLKVCSDTCDVGDCFDGLCKNVCG
jgi:hypothetical protein